MTTTTSDADMRVALAVTAWERDIVMAALVHLLPGLTGEQRLAADEAMIEAMARCRPPERLRTAAEITAATTLIAVTTARIRGAVLAPLGEVAPSIQGGGREH